MQKLKEFYNRNLNYKAKEKLSNITILFIILANILILTTLHTGSDFYKKSVNGPTSIYPRICQNIISSKDIYNTNNYFYQYKNHFDVINGDNIDSRCNELVYVKLNALQEDMYISSLIKTKENYNNNFNEAALVKDFVSYIEKNKNKIQSDYANLERLYKFKLEFVYLLFKLPLFIILFYMMKKYLLKNNYTLFVMFKSLYYAIFISIIISVYSSIFNLIPIGFVKNMIKSSYEVEALMLFYYVLMIIALFILAYIIDIYQIRHRYKSKSKNYKTNNISRTVLSKIK